MPEYLFVKDLISLGLFSFLKSHFDIDLGEWVCYNI